jgi:Holliday junction resolvase
MRSEPSESPGAALERHIGEVFRRAGWKVRRQPPAGALRPDLEVRRGKHSYVVEVKNAPEGRRDRLLPLLAQAILQAEVFARRSSGRGVPLAVVGAKRVSESIARDLEEFAREFAPKVAVGLVDMEGFQWFRGPGLESLNAVRRSAQQRLRNHAPEVPVAHLFSDLNQWMLKVLLAPRIPSEFLRAPRGEYSNASQLAVAAEVSVMTSFRFVRQLQIEGFLDESGSALRLVRVDALLERWRAASLRPAREVPMRWILRGDPSRQLNDALRAQASDSNKPSRSRRGEALLPRACLGLFAAADALGLGFVHGVPPHIYLERLEAHSLKSLGLSLEAPGPSPDVYVRVPPAKESVFRGAVRRDGVPVSDVLQVWLDAGVYPTRGFEQAEVVRRRVLQPLFGKSQR